MRVVPSIVKETSYNCTWAEYAYLVIAILNQSLKCLSHIDDMHLQCRNVIVETLLNVSSFEICVLT